MTTKKPKKKSKRFKTELHRSFKCELNKLQKFRAGNAELGCGPEERERKTIKAVSRFLKNHHIPKKFT